MLSQEDARTPVFFGVSCAPFDGSAQNGVLPAQVRSDWFASLHGSSGKIRSVEAGMECLTRYKIGRSVFEWRKTAGKTLLQKSYREKDGYFVLTWNIAGELVSKTRYGADHQWLQTCYYSGDATRPAALLKPGQDGGLFLLRFDSETQRYSQTALQPCEYKAGSAEQSLVNAVAGEPEVLAETDGGSFCYCTVEEAARREAVLNDLKSGARSALPEWPEEQDAELHFTYITNDGSKPEPKPEPKPVPSRVQKAPGTPVVSDYPANHELFSVDGPPPTRYTVAAKGLGGEARVSSAIAPGVQHATKRVVISAEESYLYFGQVIDGLRQGRGRTQMQNGMTAYDGDYVDDRRDGFGVYYYKSGKLCYAGSWKQNRREGPGVAFSSHDGSVFVGRWQDNIPTGSGAAFDAEGNLIYTGEWKDGKRHGRGTEFKNGEIVFSGEFREDRRCTGYERIDKETVNSEQ